ncbi:MAG: phosphonopyruvate decarboxylase [Spirochaetaceae bacterium]|jgi:phosphonopyruvate decarboxylase|nr:phosphonopyruvate decarboxylase [Spirochaetaceae bacterium]
MITVDFLYELLTRERVSFFTGVPDSLLKHFSAYLADNAGPERHVIAPNEGAAVALAAGYHLAGGGIPLVYMQNSGIGNAVNPLLSLADTLVYRIPMLLLIGWRGKPGCKDEPQHAKQGLVTTALLDAMEIPYAVMPADNGGLEKTLSPLLAALDRSNAPCALVVPPDSFAPYKPKRVPAEEETGLLSRESAIDRILRLSDPKEFYVSTTGMASRELYELREKHRSGHERDFLTVGSMGHASQIALGIARRRPEASVTCLDGDGALLMHMGSLAAIGTLKPPNLRHIILNNGAHDSVGGQPTVGRAIDIPAIALGCGYAGAVSAAREADLAAALGGPAPRPFLLNVLVRKGARQDLGRPGAAPEENKRAFMEALRCTR